MITERIGHCMYCGTQKIVSVDLEAPLEAADEIATADCECDAARLERGMKNTRPNIEKLLGEDSRERGFDYPVRLETVRMIETMCEQILLGNMDNVTLKEPDGDMIKLINDGNRVKISRTSKRQVTM